MNQIAELLAQYQLLFITLHVLSMAIGLGGATVSDILFFKFLKDFRISKKEEEVLHIMKDIVLGAIFVIALTGFALYVPEAERFNSSPMFLVKAIATGVVIVNGIALHMFIAPYLLHMNLRTPTTMSRGWYRLSFALGAVSVVSWYSVFLIAMTKSVLPFSFVSMLSIYLGLLAIGITGSQILEMFLRKKARS